MPKLRVKSFHPQVSVTVRTLWKETFYKEQCDLLKNSYAAGLMRLTSVSGRNADFTAPADMMISEMLRRGIDKDTFFRIIIQVVNVHRWIQSRKLSVANLVMDTDMIFVNSQTKELFMLYIPVDGGCQNGTLKSFLENLVFESSFDLGEDMQFKQELMNLINSGDALNTKTLEEYIVSFRPDLKKSFDMYTEKKNSNVAASKSEYLRQLEQLENEARNNEEKTSDYKGKGTDLYYERGRQIGKAAQGTVVIGNENGINGTVVINQNQQRGTVVLDESTPDEIVPHPCIIRRSTGEQVIVDKPVFRIGKEEGEVDFLITDNPTVSRTHADIISRNGQYFIYDNNSTNRTYVNNLIIPPLNNVEIFDGTLIRLSDEEFEFRIIDY